MSLGQNVATESQHTQRSLIAEVVTNTRSVGTDQIDLELLHVFRGDSDILEVSETGIDSVLRDLFGDNIINNLATRLEHKKWALPDLRRPSPKPPL